MGTDRHERLPGILLASLLHDSDASVSTAYVYHVILFTTEKECKGANPDSTMLRCALRVSGVCACRLAEMHPAETAKIPGEHPQGPHHAPLSQGSAIH